MEIQQAIWEDGGSGPEIVGWTTLRTAVPARIQPDHTTIDNAAAPPSSSATYRVLLADDTPLDHNHRLVGPDGMIYQVLEYGQAERIDMLPLATVKKLPMPKPLYRSQYLIHSLRWVRGRLQRVDKAALRSLPRVPTRSIRESRRLVAGASAWH